MAVSVICHALLTVHTARVTLILARVLTVSLVGQEHFAKRV